jgi:uncharacterized protein YdaU (DUF1376 family)
MPKHDHPPAYLKYPKDFLTDAKVVAMSTLGVGCYTLLLDLSWFETPVASVPNDDGALARMCRVSPDEWQELKSTVLAPWRLGKDGRWHQKRLRAEYDKILRSRKAKSDAGRLGAKVKYGNNLDSSAIASLQHRYSIPSSSPIPTGLDDEVGRKEGVRKYLSAMGVNHAVIDELSSIVVSPGEVLAVASKVNYLTAKSPTAVIVENLRNGEGAVPEVDPSHFCWWCNLGCVVAVGGRTVAGSSVTRNGSGVYVKGEPIGSVSMLDISFADPPQGLLEGLKKQRASAA